MSHRISARSLLGCYDAECPFTGVGSPQGHLLDTVTKIRAAAEHTTLVVYLGRETVWV